MACAICTKSLVDEDGGLTSGSFGNGAGAGATIPVSTAAPVSSTVEGGVTATAPKTCLQSRCSCKRFLHANCATKWLKMTPECPRCQEYLHGGLDLWQVCSKILAFIVPKSIRSLARDTWWSWTESAFIKGQQIATYFFNRRLPWGKKEHVLHRKNMLDFGAFIDESLELRDLIDSTEKSTQEARRFKLHSEATRAIKDKVMAESAQLIAKTKEIRAEAKMLAAALKQTKVPSTKTQIRKWKLMAQGERAKVDTCEAEIEQIQAEGKKTRAEAERLLAAFEKINAPVTGARKAAIALSRGAFR